MASGILKKFMNGLLTIYAEIKPTATLKVSLSLFTDDNISDSQEYKGPVIYCTSFSHDSGAVTSTAVSRDPLS